MWTAIKKAVASCIYFCVHSDCSVHRPSIVCLDCLSHYCFEINTLYTSEMQPCPIPLYCEVDYYCVLSSQWPWSLDVDGLFVFGASIHQWLSCLLICSHLGLQTMSLFKRKFLLTTLSTIFSSANALIHTMRRKKSSLSFRTIYIFCNCDKFNIIHVQDE